MRHGENVSPQTCLLLPWRRQGRAEGAEMDDFVESISVMAGERDAKGREEMLDATKHMLQESVKDSTWLEWHDACLPKHRRRQVTKVAHYYLPACGVLDTADRSVNAMTQPMQVREDEAPYGEDG